MLRFSPSCASVRSGSDAGDGWEQERAKQAGEVGEEGEERERGYLSSFVDGKPSSPRGQRGEKNSEGEENFRSTSLSFFFPSCRVEHGSGRALGGDSGGQVVSSQRRASPVRVRVTEVTQRVVKSRPSRKTRRLSFSLHPLFFFLFDVASLPKERWRSRRRNSISSCTATFRSLVSGPLRRWMGQSSDDRRRNVVFFP